jgi:hypothetical protein
MIEASMLLGPLLLAACPVATPLPDGDALVRGVLGRQRGREQQLSRYTYDVSEVKEDLDAAGNVKRRRTRELEVVVVKGRPLRRVVARDGQPLAQEEREREDRRVRELAQSGEAGRVASELPGVRISELLERYHFTASGREELDGRCAIALEFEPRPGNFALGHDAVLKRLAGRLWVDEQDEAVARIAVDNTSGIHVALGLAVSVETLALRAAFTRLADGVWLPRSVETLVVGRKLLVSAFRLRRTLRYGHYRRFDGETLGGG